MSFLFRKLNVPIGPYVYQIQVKELSQIIKIKKTFQLVSSRIIPDKVIRLIPVSQTGFGCYSFNEKTQHGIFYYSQKENSNFDFLYCLKCVLASSFIKNNLLFVHASSIIKKNMVHIFLGPSGSGKSTIAHLFEKKVFTEDEIFISFKKEKIIAYPSPFEKNKKNEFNNQSFEVIFLYILKKSKFNKIYFLNLNKESFKAIILNNLYYNYKDFLTIKYQKEITEGQTLKKIIEKVAIKKIHFNNKDFNICL